MAVAGKLIPNGTGHRSLNYDIKLNYKVREELPLTILRDGKK